MTDIADIQAIILRAMDDVQEFEGDLGIASYWAAKSILELVGDPEPPAGNDRSPEAFARRVAWQNRQLAKEREQEQEAINQALDRWAAFYLER